MADGFQIWGLVSVRLYDAYGTLKQSEDIENLVTDAGDLYYAGMAITGVSPANAAHPTFVTGMKLGTGTTAVAKNGAGAALATYLTASNQVFDATFPQTANQGAGNGVQAVYQVTYAPGTATSTSLNECVIVNDAATNATTSAANTISRVVFASAYNKGSLDTLAITWSHLFKGQ